jgi:hypothetical protein
MSSSAPEPISLPPSARDLEELAARFRASCIPHAEWTHAAHMRVAAWHIDRFGATEALARLRAGIRRLNDHHGTPNSPTRGYHETITVAYVQLIAQYLAATPAGTTFAARTSDMLAGPLGDRNVLLRHYSRDRLMSSHARAEWVPPDISPLDL